MKNKILYSILLFSSLYFEITNIYAQNNVNENKIDINTDISKFEKNINHAIFSKDTNLIINSYIEFCNYCSNIGFNSLAENYGRKAIEYSSLTNNLELINKSYISTILSYINSIEFYQCNITDSVDISKINDFLDSVKCNQENEKYILKCKILINNILENNNQNNIDKLYSLDSLNSDTQLFIKQIKAEIEFYNKNYITSISILNNILNNSKTIKNQILLLKTYKLLSQNYLLLKDYNNSNIYLNKYLELKSPFISIQNFEDQTQNLISENNLIHSKFKERIKKTRNKYRFAIALLVLVFFLTIVILIMLFNRKTRNTKLELEKNKEKLSSQKEENIHQQSIIESQKLSVKRSNEILTQSIKYAQHIQRAALSNIEEVKKLFPDSFLCYMPKDVVSGDFYYVTQIGDFNVFVIADCTGHGVPGGFLSIFGISAIKEILNRPNNNFMPGKILDSMREFIKESLSNNGEENFSTVDGMDMSVCAYNPKTHELRFAGAYLSAYIWSNGEIIRLKGDRMPVGRHVRETSDFNTQIVTLKNNDMLYMMTDGIQGQMGGLSGTKFMTKRLLQFLSENAILKCEEQKNNFEKIMKDWMFNTIQFDDMTLVGIRIN